MSCFQYIMIAVILSVGPPYRQPMLQNGMSPLSTNLVPFMVTITSAALFTTIMILFPPSWLASLLQLTPMTLSFGFLLIAIALGNFVVSWMSEKMVFVLVRNILDRFSAWRRKKRHWGGKVKVKRYQIVEEMM